MTKIPKGTITTLEGRYQAFVKNLLTVDGHDISVPIDRKVAGGVGDIIKITYDDRGFLLTSEVLQKGEPGDAVLSAIEAQHQKQKEIEQKTQSAWTPPEQIEIKKFIPDQIFIQRLITLRACYKECTDTVRCLMLVPEGEFNEPEYNLLMDIAVQRAKKDAQALMEAAGEK